MPGAGGGFDQCYNAQAADQAAVRPRPGLTRPRCAGSANSSPGNADIRPIQPPSASNPTPGRRNPPKSFADNRNPQSDRLLVRPADAPWRERPA